jgi:DNA-binding MarR family transcriptional regulator
MTDKPCEAVVEAWVRLLRAQHALLARVEDDLKRAGFPALEWYNVLLELDRSEAGWLRQSDVNARVEIAQYNMSRLVDRLEREGLVERRQCPMDARNNVLVITEAGRRLRRSMWPTYAAAIEAHVGKRLSAEEAATLAGLLGKLSG